MNKKKELRDKVVWLRGVVDGMKVFKESSVTDGLDGIANELGKAANNMCGQGFYGCSGSDNCSSDHK